MSNPLWDANWRNRDNAMVGAINNTVERDPKFIALQVAAGNRGGEAVQSRKRLEVFLATRKAKRNQKP